MNITMNLGVLFLVVAAWGAAAEVSRYPHPFLMVDRTAKVLTLRCEPPRVMPGWDSLYDLKLTAVLSEVKAYGNMSIATAMSSSQTKPTRGDVLPEIAEVRVSGDWSEKTPSLTVVMPLTAQLYGTYYCTVVHDKNEMDRKTYSFSKSFVIDEAVTLGHRREAETVTSNFHVTIQDAHEVKITWHQPLSSTQNPLKFVEASVSRTHLDKENGKAITAPRTLFATSGTNDLVYNAGVILDKFLHPSEGAKNYSIQLYVGSVRCSPFCRYGCNVPYSSCIGIDAQFCVCNQDDTSIAVSDEIKANTKTNTFMSLFIVFFILFVLLATLASIFCYLLKTGKYRNFSCLKNMVKCEQKRTDPMKIEADAEKQKDDQADANPPGPDWVEPRVVVPVNQRNQQVQARNKRDAAVHKEPYQPGAQDNFQVNKAKVNELDKTQRGQGKKEEEDTLLCELPEREEAHPPSNTRTPSANPDDLLEELGAVGGEPANGRNNQLNIKPTEQGPFREPVQTTADDDQQDHSSGSSPPGHAVNQSDQENRPLLAANQTHGKQRHETA